MTDKNIDRPFDDRPSSATNISVWPPHTSSAASSRIRIDSGSMDLGLRRVGSSQRIEPNQGPLSSLSFSSERRERSFIRNTTIMGVDSDSELEHEESPMEYPSDRLGRRRMRNTTVMTFHSESEPEYDSPSTNLPSSRRDLGQMRNTTVMTIHSDSESDIENTMQRFMSSSRQELPSLEGASIIFDNGMSSILSIAAGAPRTGVNFSRDSTDTISEDPRRLQLRRSFWQGPGTSDEDQLTSDDGEHAGSAEMFNQESDVNYGDEDDEDQESEHDDVQESNRIIKDVLGSYLLAPMGFDDDESAGNSPGLEGYSEAAERFQNFAGVNEFDESDQIGLGDNSYQVIPKSKRRDQERILENKRRQGKLLLVSLLDNFCVLYDQSPERNRKLFYVICKTLSNMGIIDEEYLEEMSAVRSSYQRAFRSLVLSALTSIKQEQMILESRRIMAPPSTPTGSQNGHQGHSGFQVGSEDIGQSISNSLSSTGIVSSAYLHTPSLTDSAFAPSAAMMRTMSFGDMFDNDPTRYKHDFVEICKLGKGGFASVFKARNKLDGIEYAIKKIRLRGGAKMRYEKIFREIKFLARLDHKNVIRYYSSWLEHADYPVSRSELHGGGGGDFDSNGDEYDDEDADEDEYTNTISMREESTIPERLRRKSSVDYFGFHNEQHTFDQDDLSMGIVFGDDEEQDDGIAFEEIQGDISFEETQGSSVLDDDADRCGSVSKSLMNSEDMERTRSASSTLPSRSIPGAAKNGHQRYNHKSPTVSVEMHDRSAIWEEVENSSSKTKDSLSTSYSVLSSSIEEIQRSLPSSYSGLGSRYARPHPKDLSMTVQDDGHGLQPFSFPNLRETNRRDFVGGGLGGLHGLGKPRGDHGPRQHRNSAGRLFTRDLTLFIQMQLCQTTLQDYLEFRNERPTSITATSRNELIRKPSKSHGLGGIPSSSNTPDQMTHSAPGSPMQQTCHKDLVDPAANQHIFRAIVEGVAYIHDQDMIHRDLKPSNIFLGLPPGLDHQRTQLRQDQFSQDSVALMSNSSSQSGMSTTRHSSNGGSLHESQSALLSNDPAECTLTKEKMQEDLFVNIESMVPKIGDFGLVTDMDGGALSDDVGPIGDTSALSPDPSTPNSAPPLLRRHGSSATTGSRSSRTRTTAVGTVTYASPEQLARPNLGYDQKADIYSLGIIFFELYHPFSTLMERHAVLRTLRNGELPPDFVSRWPKEAAFVLWLMAEDPRMRPTAREILEFELIRKPKEEPLTVSEITQTGGGASTDANRIRVTTKTFAGLGLHTTDIPDPAHPSQPAPFGYEGKAICEDCQSRCHCSDNFTTMSTEAAADCVDINHNTASTNEDSRLGSANNIAGAGSKGHRRRPSKSASSKISRSNLEQRLKEESDKVKRLEMSMAAMRAENKALLDRIQALEYEKETSWRPAS